MHRWKHTKAMDWGGALAWCVVCYFVTIWAIRADHTYGPLVLIPLLLATILLERWTKPDA